MLLISHRGNIDSINGSQENTPEYIDAAIAKGYDVEIDVWLVWDELMLGHDGPEHPIDLAWLLERKGRLWVHTKNFAALSFLCGLSLRTFYHEKENHTLINACNLIWSHNITEADENSIIPLLSETEIKAWTPKRVYGVCSDFIAYLK